MHGQWRPDRPDHSRLWPECLRDCQQRNSRPEQGDRRAFRQNTEPVGNAGANNNGSRNQAAGLAQIPKDVHSQVFELAHDHRQSLNAEIVSILSRHINLVNDQRGKITDIRQVSEEMEKDPGFVAAQMAVAALKSLSSLEDQISDAKQSLEEMLYKAKE